MAESKANWDQVGEDFKTLGRQVKQHYDQREGTQEKGASSADKGKVDDALQKLTDSLEQAFSALGEAVRDPQVGEQTKKAAGSLSDALTATFAEAGERFRKR